MSGNRRIIVWIVIVALVGIGAVLVVDVWQWFTALKGLP